MTFQESLQVCLKQKYADFNGRASQSEYWWFALATIIGNLVLSRISPMLGGLFSLAVFVPSIAAAARRLHDTNRSGWWQLIGLIPILGWIVLIVFLAMEGNSESNEYGTKPVS